ncbi:5'-3' exonuclease [Rossellomorea aquimaris]|uniref:5'-3' exonuclease n=1 Tax=Rossellomorea aquimaris TaxID=189382 RepID=UPI001CD56E57|nr:5'-3' exonuclease H3TH domain-containing protein [Rossellomorea aquimaris]MCA1054576.1 5'-3' exonuclease [Rossellomorea aquimaris]
MKKNEHVLLIDGMALLFRSFFATAVTGQFMVNSKGLPTNGVQGFMKHLLMAVDHVNPTHILVCWDMGSQTFRNDVYEDYKSNRNAPPAELIPQFDLAKEVAEGFNLVNIGVPGYEADDCIGTLAKAHRNERKVTVLSGDQDLLQLLDENIDIMLLKKGFGNYQTYTKDMFVEERGITPRQFIDVKALMGDTSDGYPGVKGIGEKTALKLIQEYGHIEGILDNLDRLTPSQRKKIEGDLEMLHVSRKLAEIHCEVPLPLSIENAVWSRVSDSSISYIEELELKVLRRYLLSAESLIATS